MFLLFQGILLYYANIYLNRTGVIYEIIDGKVVPWVILSDGPGNQTKVKSRNFSRKGVYMKVYSYIRLRRIKPLHSGAKSELKYFLAGRL